MRLFKNTYDLCSTRLLQELCPVDIDASPIRAAFWWSNASLIRFWTRLSWGLRLVVERDSHKGCVLVVKRRAASCCFVLNAARKSCVQWFWWYFCDFLMISDRWRWMMDFYATSTVVRAFDECWVCAVEKELPMRKILLNDSGVGWR